MQYSLYGCPKPGLPKMPELLLSLLFNIFLLTFGSHVANNTDFVKVLEIEMIFFVLYFCIVGIILLKILVIERLHNLGVVIKHKRNTVRPNSVNI